MSARMCELERVKSTGRFILELARRDHGVVGRHLGKYRVVRAVVRAVMANLVNVNVEIVFVFVFVCQITYQAAAVVRSFVFGFPVADEQETLLPKLHAHHKRIVILVTAISAPAQETYLGIRAIADVLCPRDKIRVGEILVREFFIGENDALFAIGFEPGLDAVEDAFCLICAAAAFDKCFDIVFIEHGHKVLGVIGMRMTEHHAVKRPAEVGAALKESVEIIRQKSLVSVGVVRVFGTGIDEDSVILKFEENGFALSDVNDVHLHSKIHRLS